MNRERSDGIPDYLRRIVAGMENSQDEDDHAVEDAPQVARRGPDPACHPGW